MEKGALTKLTIKGFKSFRDLDNFELSNINILIGANGAGKSNFISFFKMLNNLVEGRFQQWIMTQGGAERVLYNGLKTTSEMFVKLDFGCNEYEASFKPSEVGSLFISEERILQNFGDSKKIPFNHLIGTARDESSLIQNAEHSVEKECKDFIKSWKTYHFHDTGPTAKMKQPCEYNHDYELHPFAENLASFLFTMQSSYPHIYQNIVDTVKLVIPFFENFSLKTIGDPQNPIPFLYLNWKSAHSDYELGINQLSDGSLRFICLTCALLQPSCPKTILIDEPELGLHPTALGVLGALLRKASKRMQVIVSTQSPGLVGEFGVEDLIVVERDAHQTAFRRLHEQDFSQWLEDYSTGELWEKNILGGRP